MPERSVDTIMHWLTTTVQSKMQISPQQFVEAAQYLVILVGDEHIKLYDLEQKVAQMKLEMLPSAKSVAEVKLRIEATDTYKEMRKQQARIKQIDEMIRVAKLLGRMKNDEINHQ
jgi:hypothetical protein